MGTPDGNLWPKLQSKLEENYELKFHGPDLISVLKDDGLHEAGFLYIFERKDHEDDSWPKTIRMMLKGQQASFEFIYSNVEKISTKAFEYQNLGEVKNVISACKKKNMTNFCRSYKNLPSE
eukprot:GHVP01061030.1.p1 GENE.GHVP01061030.1~~GHVP01061030.1.p1  ORF type:complete len:121 (+),score=21.27 GHVP01061030.1:215-577(+)